MKHKKFIKLFNRNENINYKEFFSTHKQYVNECNIKISQYMSIMATAFSFVGLIVSMSVPFLNKYSDIYTVFFIISLIFGLILLFRGKTCNGATIFTYILFGFIYLVISILGTKYNPNSYSGIYTGVSVLLELLIIDRPWHIGTFTGSMNCIFIILAFIYKPFEIAFVDASNSIIMLTIGYLMILFNIGNVVININNKENEINTIIKESKMQITASQVKPHFIFNALTTIQYLCKSDPKSAEKTVSHLAKYIRNNMESINNTTPVTFQNELKHLQNYLYIEKLRYGDRLEINYDINTSTDFMIPFFSIQPLVENAIRHGIAKKENGGTVTISTCENTDSYIIKIIDNGVGFDTQKKLDDGKEHLGLEIVRSRIEAMCGGKFTIESIIGVGTTSEIKLPRKSKNATLNN